MKKRMILFALSVALIIGMLSAGNAYAWFASLDGGSTVANNITAGQINYALGDGAFVVPTDGDIYPEQNLLTGAVGFANASDTVTNIDTCARVRVTYTYGKDENEEAQTHVWDPTDSDCVLDVTYSNSWVYSSGYLYYGGTSGFIAANSGDIPLFTKICYSGDNTDDTLAEDQSETITVIYEVRQKDNVSWS